MRIRYFAWLRHRVGTAEETLDLPPHVATLADLKSLLAARHAGFAESLAAQGVVRCAVNHAHVTDDATPLAPTDEVAFFPPVTGG